MSIRAPTLWLFMAVPLASVPLPMARADVGSFLLGSKIGADGVEATYRKGNQIRAWARVSRDLSAGEAQRLAVRHIAEMTKAKGYDRFAIVKVSDCGTMMMNGIPMYHSCRLIAQMVSEGEEAKPERGQKVRYLQVAEVLSGPDYADLRANMMSNGSGLAEAVEAARESSSVPQDD